MIIYNIYRWEVFLDNFIKKLRDFNELVMFEHSVFSLPFIFIAMIVASNGWIDGWLILLGIVAAISARNAAMAFNRLVDRKYDILNPRTSSRPSVDGRIRASSIAVFTILNSMIFIITAYFINSLAFYLSVPMLVIVLGYSYFKRFSFLAHIVLGLSLAMAPIAGCVAVNGSIELWAIYLSIGVMFWVGGFDLLYSLQDIEFDIKNNLHSIPSQFGPNNTMLISLFFHILTVVFWLLFVIEAHLGIFAIMGVIFSSIMLMYEHYLVRKDFTKIDRAFFTVNGYLGFVFLALIIIDEVVL